MYVFVPLATWAQSCTRRRWQCPSCRLLIVILTWYSHTEKLCEFLCALNSVMYLNLVCTFEIFTLWNLQDSGIGRYFSCYSNLEILKSSLDPFSHWSQMCPCRFWCCIAFCANSSASLPVKMVSVLILIGLGCCLFIRDSINPKSSICLLQLHFDCFILIPTFSAGWQLDGPFVYDPTCICGHASFNHRGHGTTFTMGVQN